MSNGPQITSSQCRSAQCGSVQENQRVQTFDIKLPSERFGPQIREVPLSGESQRHYSRLVKVTVPAGSSVDLAYTRVMENGLKAWGEFRLDPNVSAHYAKNPKDRTTWVSAEKAADGSVTYSIGVFHSLGEGQVNLKINGQTCQIFPQALAKEEQRPGTAREIERTTKPLDADIPSAGREALPAQKEPTLPAAQTVEQRESRKAEPEIVSPVLPSAKGVQEVPSSIPKPEGVICEGDVCYTVSPPGTGASKTVAPRQLSFPGLDSLPFSIPKTEAGPAKLPVSEAPVSESKPSEALAAEKALEQAAEVSHWSPRGGAEKAAYSEIIQVKTAALDKITLRGPNGQKLELPPPSGQQMLWDPAFARVDVKKGADGRDTYVIGIVRSVRGQVSVESSDGVQSIDARPFGFTVGDRWDNEQAKFVDGSNREVSLSDVQGPGVTLIKLGTQQCPRCHEWDASKVGRDLRTKAWESAEFRAGDGTTISGLKVIGVGLDGIPPTAKVESGLNTVASLIPSGRAPYGSNLVPHFILVDSKGVILGRADGANGCNRIINENRPESSE